MRRKENEACFVSFTTLPSCIPNTQSFFIVSSLVRTWVSWKCLDFDIFLEDRQSGLPPFQGSYTAVLKVPNLGASAEPRANYISSILSTVLDS